jgi:hypothetical protein
MPKFISEYEEIIATLEKETPNEMEMAKKAFEEGKAKKKIA